MFATRLHGCRDVRWEEIPDVMPGTDEVRIKVVYNGLCGSDLHMYFRNKVKRDPFVLGHEFSGVVDAVGPGVIGIRPGTPVAVRPFHTCGLCIGCGHHLDHLCSAPDILGCGSVLGGGLADYCLARADMVFPLPPGVSLELGALIEPMAVSYNGILRAGVKPGMSVVLFGAGPIGVGVLLGLRALGIDDVMVVEPSSHRRSVIAALGARQLLDPACEDIAAAVHARTSGQGADVVFECAGTQSSFTQALTVAGNRGRVVILAVYEDPIVWNPAMISHREIEVRAAKAYEPGVFEAVIELMARGHYPTTGWVEHIRWSALVEDGLEPLRRGQRMKVLVDVAR